MDRDLEKRTMKFSKEVISLCKKIKNSRYNLNIINQVLRSSTSVRANYREANGASSRNDFRNKIYICKKEIQETKYWLELLLHTEPEYNTDIEDTLKEGNELSMIFGKIASSLKN